MKPAVIAFLVLPLSAIAQYKCVDAAGRVTFQQSACATQDQQQPLKLRADEPAAPASEPTAKINEGGNADQRLLRKLQGERRALELERAVQGVELNIANRSVQMSNELAGLRALKANSKGDLSGATFEQSISSEMQAVTQKYKVLNDTDQQKLKQLRGELVQAKRTAGQQERQ